MDNTGTTMEYDVNNREIYKKEWVVDTSDSRLSVRNFLEHRDLRLLLNVVKSQKQIHAAAEFGCGFGRMTQVLTEFSRDVTGIEREQILVDEAVSLIPAAAFCQSDDLSQTSFPDDSFDVIITFTFLQHLIDEVASKVANEMVRCLNPGGFILICEETDVNHQIGDPNNPNKICTIGRAVDTYKEFFPTLNLKQLRRREIKPGCDRKNTGEYMLFQKENRDSRLAGKLK